MTSERMLCPVCQVTFLLKEERVPGKRVVCPVCGAVLTLTEENGFWVLRRPKDMSPEEEIRARVENFAQLRGYHFNEMKEPLIEALLKKYERYGDFYCPCKIDNIPENVCPCLETRQGSVERNGRCHCGLFWK
ncbi:ferredoxin-thioredoxin reductase catalytic domain-containing protein [Candidatus Caldatribacterium saccharofermentans]|uniref:Ferredoxin:thioredoxin reductase n=1 Tax=Candidatus Caldatribacterium saccharofermentans TaxID=1454753 RepID=A0A7V4TE86_9BACT